MGPASGHDWILRVLADLRDAARNGDLAASADALQLAMDTLERETAGEARARAKDGHGMDGPAER